MYSAYWHFPINEEVMYLLFSFQRAFREAPVIEARVLIVKQRKVFPYATDKIGLSYERGVPL